MTGPLERAGEARRRLVEQMAPDAVAVIPAAVEQPRNRDVDHPFRQDSDFRYLTGFPEPDAVAVIAPGRAEGEFVLFCRARDPEREQWTGRRAGPEGATERYGADEAHPLDELGETLPSLLLDRRRVLFPLGRSEHWDRSLTAWLATARRLARGTRAVPREIALLEGTVHELRLRKSDAELECMQRAAGLTATAHRRAMQAVRADMPEYQLEAEILHVFQRQGATTAYPSIVAGGANACILHYVDHRDILRDGDLVLVDAGAELEGYAADVTRTFPVNGRFTAPQRAIYEVVLAAQEAAIAAVRSGRGFNEFHEEASRVLGEGLVELGLLRRDGDHPEAHGALRSFFPHRTGHWLGLDVHDVGATGSNGGWRVLEPGMVVTVEPGLYVPMDREDVDPQWRGIGVRIEDDIVVTEDGPRNLTADVPKTVDEVEAWMANS